MTKILVAYYSRTGQTRKLALDIAEKLKAEIDEIKDKRKRKGFLGYILAGRDAFRKNLTEIEYNKNPEDYRLLHSVFPENDGPRAPGAKSR